MCSPEAKDTRLPQNTAYSTRNFLPNVQEVGVTAQTESETILTPGITDRILPAVYNTGLHLYNEVYFPEKTRIVSSPRQYKEITLVASGLSNDEIASILGISTPTVKGHISKMLFRADAYSRMGLVAKGIERGELRLEDIPIPVTPDAFNSLSPREHELMEFFEQHPDYCNKEAARHLYISLRTVKYHISSILQKTGSTNMLHAYVKYIKTKRGIENSQGTHGVS